MKNVFYQHNRTGKNRVTVCGVFVEEKKVLVISGASIPETSFRRHIGRNAALTRTSVRPMYTVPCNSWSEAKNEFQEKGPILLRALSEAPDLWKIFPKYSRYAESSGVAEPAESASTELGTPIVKSLLNQKLATA